MWAIAKPSPVLFSWLAGRYAPMVLLLLFVWRGGELVPCTPPHDILDQPVAGHLPGEAAGVAGGPGIEVAHVLLSGTEALGRFVLSIRRYADLSSAAED